MSETTIEFECAVCHNLYPLPGDLDSIPDGQDVVCDDCFRAIADGVCGVSRRGYACLRPKDHEPAGVHGSVDGRWIVTWSDAGLGVTLKKRPTS
jgi:hypothetical protein